MSKRLLVLVLVVVGTGCQGQLDTGGNAPEAELGLPAAWAASDASDPQDADALPTLDAGTLPAPVALPDAGLPPAPDAGPPPSPPAPPEPPAPPPVPTMPACAHRTLLAWGLHPLESDRLRCAGVTATRITQTIGSAPASAGYHARDGYVAGAPYTVAVDLRARDLTETQLRALLGRLATNGFAGWYRKPGYDGWPSSEAPHIHAVWAGAPMKSQLEMQVRDWLAGRNGLTSHTVYRFWSPTDDMRTIVRNLFAHR